MTEKTIICPYCKYPLKVDVEFAKKNGRVFCNTCCKSFEVVLEEEEDKHIGDFWD